MDNRPQVQVGIVENAGPNTLASFLRNAGSGACGVEIASAFVTSQGLGLVSHLLKKATAKGRVRIITGLFQGFTEPNALRALLQEQQEAEGKLSIRLSRDCRFHWKAYFLLHRKIAHVVVGSSNLTDNGLRQSGELNVVLSLSQASKAFSGLHGAFVAEWEDAVPLTQAVLERYERWRSESGAGGKGISVPVARILGTVKPNQTVPTPEEGKPRYWLTGIDGTLARETMAVLRETTNWDRKNYWYFSTWRSAYAKGDRVVLFDLDGRTVRVVEIVATTRTPAATPDGRLFAAYRKVKGIQGRRLVKSRWRSLKAVGLIRRKADAFLTRRISQAKFERFVENLNSRSGG
jgi:HKD family nuclease